MPDAPTIPGYTLQSRTVSIDRHSLLTYRSDEPIPLPPPTPDPIPTPTPDGIRVPPGADWRPFVKSGATVLLPRGWTYTGSYVPTGVPMAGVTLGTYGDPNLAAPKIMATHGGACLNLIGWRTLAIDGIDFIGTGLAPVLRFAIIDGLTLANCRAMGGSFGVVVEVPDNAPGKRNKNVRIIGNRIIDNDRPGGDDSSGLYIDHADGIEITGNVFDRNGWSDTSGRTLRNHNAYIHGSNGGGAMITGNVFARAASHGLQARSGGIVRGNVFLDNPIHLSYGLVNGGGPVFAGGVTGEIVDNVFMGSADIAPTAERGIAIQVGNVRQLTIARNWIGSDNGSGVRFPAISVERCNLNPDHKGGPEVGVLTLTIADNRVDWRGEPYKASVPVQHPTIQQTWGGPLPDVRSKIPWADVLPKLRDGRMSAGDLLAMTRGMM